MSKAIFITAKDFKRYSNIDGSVDNDNLIQWIEVAQDTHIQGFLGTDLYQKLQALIVAGTLSDAGNEAYKTLVETYIKPALVRWSLVEYLPFAPFEINRGGIQKHTSENAEAIDSSDVAILEEKSRKTAQHYSVMLVNYICANTSDFPEYSTNSDGDMNPVTNNFLGGWVI